MNNVIRIHTFIKAYRALLHPAALYLSFSLCFKTLKIRLKPESTDRNPDTIGDIICHGRTAALYVHSAHHTYTHTQAHEAIFGFISAFKVWVWTLKTESSYRHKTVWLSAEITWAGIYRYKRGHYIAYESNISAWAVVGRCQYVTYIAGAFVSLSHAIYCSMCVLLKGIKHFNFTISN